MRPTPDDVRESRHAAGLSQAQAAVLIDGTMRAIQGYESGERAMSAGLWRLFRARAALLRFDNSTALAVMSDGLGELRKNMRCPWTP